MRVWEIWCEGWRATGGEGGAYHVANVEAETFQDACDLYAKYTEAWAKTYDSKKLSNWGCRLYDNEEDAKKAFG